MGARAQPGHVLIFRHSSHFVLIFTIIVMRKSATHDPKSCVLRPILATIVENVCMHLAATQPLLVNPGFCVVHESYLLSFSKSFFTSKFQPEMFLNYPGIPAWPFFGATFFGARCYCIEHDARVQYTERVTDFIQFRKDVERSDNSRNILFASQVGKYMPHLPGKQVPGSNSGGGAWHFSALACKE